MRVLKFGGTSMGDEHTWRKVLRIIERYDHPIVIVSATARTTRRLIAAAKTAVHDIRKAKEISAGIEERHKELIANFMSHYESEKIADALRESDSWIDECMQKLTDKLNIVAEQQALTPRLQDTIASIGEELSSRLLVHCASVSGLPAFWVDASEVIKTDSDFGNANPDYPLIMQRAKPVFGDRQNDGIPIMGGYYGSDSDGHTTTLGFEGSDLTAGLVGAALDAEAIEIWTDVSGIYTCDPRVVKKAVPISELSFREATELAYFGAKVLHPATMNPAEQKQIPIQVKNIFEPEHPGTKIQGVSSTEGYAKAMTFLEDVAIVSVTSPHTRMGYEFLSDVFEVLKVNHIPVNVVTTTEASVSVALKKEKVETSMLDLLEKIGKTEKKEDQGIISLIGCNFNNGGILSDMVLNALPDREISMISYSRAKRNFNMVLPQQALKSAVKAIHKNLFET